MLLSTQFMGNYSNYPNRQQYRELFSKTPYNKNDDIINVKDYKNTNNQSE